MAGRPLRRAFSFILAASLAAQAGAIDVSVPREGPKPGSQNGTAGGAIGGAKGPVGGTPQLDVNLAGAMKVVPGAPTPTVNQAPPVMAPAAAAPAPAAPAPALTGAPSALELREAMNPPEGKPGHDPARPVFWPADAKALFLPPARIDPARMDAIVQEYLKAKAAKISANGAQGQAAAILASPDSSRKIYDGALGETLGILEPYDARQGNRFLGALLGKSQPTFGRRGQPVVEASPQRAAPSDEPVPAIIFDVRGSRGGHGDVAAAYLTAFDLLDRTQGRGDAHTPLITFIADAPELLIFSKLTGRPIGNGDAIFAGGARVYSPETLPVGHPPADVIMNLAASEGEYGRHDDLRWTERSDESSGLIPVTEKTVILTQTVFGNTESDGGQVATALISGKRLELSHAGLHAKDAGIYTDPVARALRGLTREKTRQFVLAEADRTEVKGAAAIAAVLKGEVLRGAEPGLAYGISMKSVKKQFEGYLKGLSARAVKTNGSYVLFTPSGFKLEEIKNRRLRERIEVIDGDHAMPEKAEPGVIYIVKTGTLPHPLFVGLMAYARPPPVLAGDGAMSAAVTLGRPFVMTQVDWNALNVDQFAGRLMRNAPASAIALMKDVYFKPNLERALELQEYEAAFLKTSADIPSLTDTMFAAVQAARDAAAPEMGLDGVISGVSDPVLRASLVSLRAEMGDAEARDYAYAVFAGDDKRARRLLASAIARRLFLPKSLGKLDLHFVNMAAARLALRFGMN